MLNLLRRAKLLDPIELSNMSPEDTLRASLPVNQSVLPNIPPMDHSFGSTSARTLEFSSLISTPAEPEASGRSPFSRFEDYDRESLLDDPAAPTENGLPKTGSLVPELSDLKSNHDNSFDRQDWSEVKCRRVLVKYCQHIPRNHHYTDGVQKIYQILREHLGDENMGLSIGVLHELIEVDTMFTWEDGAAFKRWQFDHSLRKMDLTNSHCPRLGNIIVGKIILTSKLQDWRDMHPQRQRGLSVSSGTSISPSKLKPHYGLHSRNVWKIENSLFVTSKHDGTRVYYCPTLEEQHLRGWNEEFGRCDRFIYWGPAREIPFSDTKGPILRSPDPTEHVNSAITELFRKQNIEADSGEADSNQLLRGKTKVPNAMFAHKHGLTPDLLRLSISEQPLPIPLSKFTIGLGSFLQKGPNIGRGKSLELVSPSKNRTEHIGMLKKGTDIFADMPCAEALAIKRNVQALRSSQKEGTKINISGPFTSNLFFDDYLDFDWQPKVLSHSLDSPSIIGASDQDLSVPTSNAGVGAIDLNTEDERLATANLALARHAARVQQARSLSGKK